MSVDHLANGSRFLAQVMKIVNELLSREYIMGMIINGIGA